MQPFSDQTLAAISTLRNRDHERIGELGRSQVLLHDGVRPVAVVLYHGLSASPQQFVRFANELHERGHNVVVPRLPRHGHENRLSRALEFLTADDLRGFARENFVLASGVGQCVVVAGFSLGGLLATWTAQHLPVHRAVAIAPFFGISWMPNRLMGALTQLLLAMPNQFQWWDPIARENQMPAHGYPRYATHAIAQAYILARDVLDRADRGVAARELIFVTNEREAAVNNRAVRRLERKLRESGAAEVQHVAIAGIPYSHDIIEPLRHPKIAEHVFPTLLELIEGK
jgi:esterase/lipase